MAGMSESNQTHQQTPGGGAVPREPHKLEHAGSTPAPATIPQADRQAPLGVFCGCAPCFAFRRAVRDHKAASGRGVWQLAARFSLTEREVRLILGGSK